MISSIRTGTTNNAAGFAKVYEKQKELIQIKGKAGGVHSFSQEEMTAFSIHINTLLGDDADLKSVAAMGLSACSGVTLRFPGTCFRSTRPGWSWRRRSAMVSFCLRSSTRPFRIRLTSAR